MPVKGILKYRHFPCCFGTLLTILLCTAGGAIRQIQAKQTAARRDILVEEAESSEESLREGQRAGLRAAGK